MEFGELLERLQQDYPKLKFRVGKKFMYRPPRTVYYEKWLGGGDLRVNKKMIADGALGVQGDVLGAGGEEFEAQGERFEAGGEEFEQNNYRLQLLHEVGHAVLQHATYETDVERVKIERAAWEKAAELCGKYGVKYDEEFVEAELDTYRNWLYQRSKCPDCQMVRYQDQKGIYHCPFCGELGVSRDNSGAK